MEFEQDYIMRMIKGMGQIILKLFGKSGAEERYATNYAATPLEELYQRLLELADRGLINEAENLLFREMDRSDKAYLEMAMNFYRHIEEMSDDFLAAHHYSRAEIAQGIQMGAAEYGITGLDLLFEDGAEE